MADIVPVVLAGGSGTRLWPLSRKLFPKQFQPLTGDHSMLQETLLRLAGVPHAPAVIVCSEEHRFLVAEQCRELAQEPGDIILEPVPRNTAPAIALGAMAALRRYNDPILLVLPSDHFIGKTEVFAELVQTAAAAVGDGLMTFGIVPTSPETGYGYIETAEPLTAVQGIRPVSSFVEKPDRARAQAMLEDGRHLWNSGMFLFRASSYLAELGRQQPEMYQTVERAFAEGEPDLDFFRPGSSFLDCPSDSIDYAVMERTDRALVVPADIGWSDLGSWSALWEVSAKDDQGNAKSGDVVALQTTNSYIHADHRLVTTIGLESAVVVETRDAVLIADKRNVQDVKSLVDNLKALERTEHESHVRVFRPWGSYEGLEQGPGFQVKRITVKPGASLSLQMHHHRSEHWIVVSGVAEVVRDDEQFSLHANESTYIPLGARHRLSNAGTEMLELIEVQVGSYLGEDDIVRFEDVYGRTSN